MPAKDSQVGLMMVLVICTRRQDAFAGLGAQQLSGSATCVDGLHSKESGACLALCAVHRGR